MADGMDIESFNGVGNAREGLGFMFQPSDHLDGEIAELSGAVLNSRLEEAKTKRINPKIQNNSNIQIKRNLHTSRLDLSMLPTLWKNTRSPKGRKSAHISGSEANSASSYDYQKS